MESFPLRSRRPGADVADLRAWGRTLGGVRVVGLGEATHGTSEFFTLKHRVIEYLVAEHGTRVVAFEASEAAATRVDRWLSTGEGDAREVLGGLGFWIWDTVEVLALLHGLRRINAGRPARERVRFVGVDPQRPGLSVEAVSAVLDARERPELARAVREVTSRIAPHSTPTDVEALREALALVAADPGDRPAQTLAHAARVARSALLATAGAQPGFSRTRDRLMAAAVRAVADDEAGPVAFWAHNAHVRTRAEPVAATGAHLRRWLGPGYYALGLLAADGSFRARRSRGPLLPPARRPSVHRLGPACAATVEGRVVAEAGGDRLVDLRRADVPGWLRGPSWAREHGASAPMFPARAAAPVVPTEEFDGLAVVTDSAPSTSLR